MNILFIGDKNYQNFKKGFSLYEEKCKHALQIDLVEYKLDDPDYDLQTKLNQLKLNSKHQFIFLERYYLKNEWFNVEDNKCALRNLVNFVDRKILFYVNTNDLRDFFINQRSNFDSFSDECEIVRSLLDGTHGFHRLMEGTFEILDYSSLKTVQDVYNLIDKLINNQSLDNFSIDKKKALSLFERPSKENFMQTQQFLESKYRNYWRKQWETQSSNRNRNDRLSFINETIKKLYIVYSPLYQSFLMSSFFSTKNHEYLVNETCSLLNGQVTNQTDLLDDCIKSITILSDAFSFNRTLFRTRQFIQLLDTLSHSSNNQLRLQAAKIFENYAKTDPKSFMDDLKRTKCENIFELVVSLFESAVTNADLDYLATHLKVEFVEIICSKFYECLNTIPVDDLTAYLKLPICVFDRIKEQKLTDSLFGLMSRLVASIESIFSHVNIQIYSKLDVPLFELASVFNSFAFKALNECTRNYQLKRNVWNFIRCINSIYTFAIDNLEKVRNSNLIMRTKMTTTTTTTQSLNSDNNENQIVRSNTILSRDFYDLIRARMPEEGMLFDMETNLLSVLRIDMETLHQKLAEAEKQSTLKDVQIREAQIQLDKIKLDFEAKCDEIAGQNETIKRMRARKLQEHNRSDHQVQLNSDHHTNDSVNSENSVLTDDFLAKIRAEYASLNDKMRKLVKGTVRNLISLNSSRTQFVYEIIQNADDCEYDENTVMGKRSLSFTLDDEYILVTSNQKGFTSADVESLCSISCSNKLKSKHVGHKGIGWKSVFSCTNMPHVYSNDCWRFYFKIQENVNDEMAYLCPFYLEDADVPPALKDSIDNRQTFFYFPLKESIVKNLDIKRTFFEDLTHKLNPFVVLFTRNLTQIIFKSNRVGNLKHEQYNVNKQFISELNNVTYEQTSFKSVCFYDVTLTSQTQETVKEWTFHMVNCELSVPDDVIDEQDRDDWDNKMTRLSIAFPTNDLSNTYDIFSYMPMCNLGLKFALNANWSLVTSRESILESDFNDFLKDSLVNLFGLALEQCPIVKKNIHNLLSHTSYREDRNKFKLWHRLIEPIKSKIKQTLNDSNYITRLVDENLLAALDLDSQLIEKSLNIRLIDKDANLTDITEDEMTEYGLRRLHLNDLLNLPYDELNFDDERWCKFFSLCLESHSSGQLDVRKAKNSKLFLTKRQDLRTPLPSIDCHLYVNNLQDQSIQKWLKNRTHHPVKVVDYKSDVEKKFLLQVIGLPHLSLNALFDIIHFELHLNVNEQATRLDNVWHDLELVKNNVQALSELKTNSLFVQSLLIPTVGQPLTRCKLAKLANILGYTISNGSETIVDFERFNSETLKVRLEWERFFLVHLKCQLVETPNVQEKTLDQLFELTQHKDLIVEMLNQLNPDSLSIVKSLPVRLNAGIFTISNLFLAGLVDDVPTSVNFPHECVGLAELLGINTKLTAESCANVLRTLVRAEITNTSLYLKWFRNMFNLMSVTPISTLKYEKLIYLEHERDYFCPDEILFTDDELLQNVCKHARKPVISAKTNACYLNIQDVLVGIVGVKRSNLKLDDVILAVINCKQNPNLVDYQTLTKQGCSEFMNLYALLEQIIIDQLNLTGVNLKGPPEQVLSCVDRDSCESIRHSLEKVPVVLHNRQLKSSEEMLPKGSLFTCRENSIVASLFDANEHSDELKANCYFVHCQLTKISPYLLELLKVKYIENECVFKLHHKAKRAELTSGDLNNLVAEFVQTPDVEIILVDQMDNSIEYLNCFRNRLRKSDEITNKSQLRKVRINKYNCVIYDDKWLYIKLDMNMKDEKLRADTGREYQNRLNIQFNQKLDLLTSAVNYLIRKKGLKKHVNQLHQQLQRKNLFWKLSSGHANASADRFNLDDVVLNLKERIYNAPRSCNTTEIVYRNRLLEAPSSDDRNVDLRPANNEGSWRAAPSPSTSFNMKYNLEIGAKAEAFFKVYLDTLGLQIFSDYEWVSSNSSTLMEYNAPIDDSLGYDFKIFKSVNEFSPHVPKTCYVEVKGTNRTWDRQIHMSSNEFDFSKSLDPNESVYILLIVENVDDQEIRIVRKIDLTNNPTSLRQIKVEQYLFEYVG